MKEFFKYTFASFFGFIFAISFIFGVAVFGMILFISLNSSNDGSEISAHSILKLDFQHPIVDRGSKKPLNGLDWLSFESSKEIGLNEILRCIEVAKNDTNIDAIYLNLDHIATGWATIEEIREALADFKKSKKKVIAFGEVFTQKAYYLASVSDRIYLHPEGYIEFRGLKAQYTFFKNALEKLGIEVQVLRVGSFKSAVEPFINDKMSEANKKQSLALLNSVFKDVVNSIGRNRQIRVDSLFEIAENLSVRDANSAQKNKLADALAYEDQVLNELKKLCYTTPDESLNLVDIYEYKNSGLVKRVAHTLTNENTDKKIAIIYASGSIVNGQGEEDEIGSEKFAETIREAREDLNVKAIVLRINSPGGYALASDVIWHEVNLAAKIKPVITSMGDFAASGGYYMACASNKIIANKNTITGSIGIFGLLPNVQKLMNEKIGITFDGVQTSRYADLGDITRPLRDDERLILQNNVNKGYETFLRKVALGRKRTLAQIDSVAQGRVWSGSDAIKNGLVDENGGLSHAIRLATQAAHLKRYSIEELPKEKNLLFQFIEGWSTKAHDNHLKESLGEHYRTYQEFKNISSVFGIQARLYSIPEIQ